MFDILLTKFDFDILDDMINEEQLPEKNCRSTVGRQSAERQWTDRFFRGLFFTTTDNIAELFQ